MPKINPRAQVLSLSGFARASNPAHREFHRVILERLTAEFATRYGLGQLREEYVAMMAREQAAAERFKGRNLSQTKAVAQLYNDLRAQYVGVIRLLKVYARMPMPAQAQAAQRMLHHVDVNIDKIRLRYSDITGNLYRFLHYMQQPGLADAVDALHLGEALQRVAELKEAFRALYNERTQELHDLFNTEKTRLVRPLTDQAATNFFKGIQVVHMQNALITKNLDVDHELGEVMFFINSQIYAMKLEMSRGKRRKKADEAQEEDKD